MLARERKKLILEYLKNNNIVKVEELSKKYEVSEATIRRDLNDLENQKLLNRIHGGATSLKLMTREPDYLYRKEENTAIKNALAKESLSLIKDNMLIFLDAGTSVFEIAKLILESEYKNLTLVTNDINTAYLIYKAKKHKLIIVGGTVYAGDGHIQGVFSSDFIDNIYPEIAFIGASSIDNNLNILTPDENKIFQKRSIINNSNISVVVANSTKFDKKSIYKIANLTDVDYLITDYNFTDQQLSQLNDTNIIKL